jgi:hypothetical protein
MDKFPPNLVSMLDCSEEAASTEAKAHRDLERSAVVAAVAHPPFHRSGRDRQYHGSLCPFAQHYG